MNSINIEFLLRDVCVHQVSCQYRDQDEWVSKLDEKPAKTSPPPLKKPDPIFLIWSAN